MATLQTTGWAVGSGTGTGTWTWVAEREGSCILGKMQQLMTCGSSSDFKGSDVSECSTLPSESTSAAPPWEESIAQSTQPHVIPPSHDLVAV